jgi:hypothetical protein
VAYEISKQDLVALFERRPEIMILVTQTVAERIDQLNAPDVPSEAGAPVARRATFAEQFLRRMRAFFG